jgi:hypothetical protein
LGTVTESRANGWVTILWEPTTAAAGEQALSDLVIQQSGLSLQVQFGSETALKQVQSLDCHSSSHIAPTWKVSGDDVALPKCRAR